MSDRRRGARRIHENVDPPKSARDFLLEGLDAWRVDDIDFQRKMAVAFECRDDCLRLVFAGAISDDDTRARLCEQFGRCCAYSAGAANDNGDFPFQ